MKKEIWFLVILAVVIVILIGFLLWPTNKNPAEETTGIHINSLKANQEVSSPLKITGVVTGNGWSGFEGQVGGVSFVLDSDPSHDVSTYLKATTEWTKLPTSFEADFDFLPLGPGKLVFQNENPSGDPAKSKTFVLPIKVVEGGTMVISAFFAKNEVTGSTCSVVFPLPRRILKTAAVARAALEELLKGPTEDEKAQGYFSNINPGVKIQSLTIDGNGTAKADFSSELESTGGSCRVTEIRSEINFTLKQFPTVKNVVISINGKTEDILQP